MDETRDFLDTNILLYAVSTLAHEQEKARIARSLVDRKSWAWSAQVAAEFARASTSPRKPVPLSRGEARWWIESWMPYPMQPVDGDLVLEALALSARYQISHYDAQILAAAKRQGCAVVYSEDMNHGQDYGGVRVINPFLTGAV